MKELDKIKRMALEKLEEQVRSVLESSGPMKKFDSEIPMEIFSKKELEEVGYIIPKLKDEKYFELYCLFRGISNE